MTAEMEAGFPRDRVLEMASISQEQWDLTQETWLLRMAKQGQQRKLALLDRYNELLAKHRKAAQRKMRAEKRKLKGPMPVAPEAHLSPLARSQVDDSGATFQKPSFADAPAAFVAPSPPVGGPAWAAAAAAPVAVPPIVTAPPAVASVDITAAGERSPLASGPAWLQPPAAASVDVTSAGERSPLATGPAWLSTKAPARAEAPRPAPPPPAGLPALAGPAWLQSSASFPAVVAPAAPAQGAAPASARAVAPPPAHVSHGSETTRPALDLGLSAGDRAAWAAALDAPDPSAAQATTAQATTAQATTAQATTAQATAAQATAAQAKKQKFATTMGSDFVPSPFAGPAWAAAQAKAAAQAAGDGAAKSTSTDALPFQRSAGAAATPPAQAVAPTTAPPVTSGGLPFQRVAPPVAAPPAAQARPAGPRLTVEQLAWLQAQIETSPELGRAARDSLGLNDAEYAAERAFWQGRFQQDRAAVERYSQLFYHYRRPR